MPVICVVTVCFKNYAVPVSAICTRAYARNPNQYASIDAPRLHRLKRVPTQRKCYRRRQLLCTCGQRLKNNALILSSSPHNGIGAYVRIDRLDSVYH